MHLHLFLKTNNSESLHSEAIALKSYNANVQRPQLWTLLNSTSSQAQSTVSHVVTSAPWKMACQAAYLNQFQIYSCITSLAISTTNEYKSHFKTASNWGQIKTMEYNPKQWLRTLKQMPWFHLQIYVVHSPVTINHLVLQQTWHVLGLQFTETVLQHLSAKSNKEMCIRVRSELNWKQWVFSLIAMEFCITPKQTGFGYISIIWDVEISSNNVIPNSEFT